MIDLPEALPFAIEPSIKEGEAEKELFNFIQALEKAFKESFCYIGIYRTVPLEKMFYRSMLEPSDGVYMPREFTFFTYFSTNNREIQ